MDLRLTYYGWMVTRHLANTGRLKVGDNPRGDLLLDLWTGGQAPAPDSFLAEELLQEGFIEPVPAGVRQAETLLRYQRNPFEHLQKIIFEFTTLCNFQCDHCYNAHVPRQTETRPDVLKAAALTFQRMGIRRFDFVGGEVSRYGDGWLDLAQSIHSLEPGIQVSLYTNGWWLDQKNFLAAGRTYLDPVMYLEDMKANGVSHVVFSLDGPGDLHDASRHHPGLYQHILAGLEQVKRARLIPRVSLLLRPEWSDDLVEDFLAELATRLYEPDLLTPASKRALRLMLDPGNSISHFIDIGNGAKDDRIQFPILDVRRHALHCKNFYRLSPSLTIKANGELATCRLTNAGEGYGNLHDRNLVAILNHFNEAFVYRLHAERRLEEYLPLLDRTVFGENFTHLCTLRAILTLLARRMEEEGVDFDDQPAIQRINREVAIQTGHAPSKAKILIT